MNFLWIFLSMFLNSGQDAATLLGLYRQSLKNERKIKQSQAIDISCARKKSSYIDNINF